MNRTTVILHKLAGIIGEMSGLPEDAIDPRESFLDLGFDSLTNAEFINHLDKTLQAGLSQSLYMEFPTVRQLSAHLVTMPSIADKLADTLADEYRIRLNAQGLHWNVEGPLFYSVHKLTEEQYEELADSIDAVAERIRDVLGWTPRFDDLDTIVRTSLEWERKIAAGDPSAYWAA
mgnify:CR=1 FL=1